MIWWSDRRKSQWIRISIKFKSWIWSSCLCKKICRVSGFNMSQPAKTEITQVFNSSIEMMSFAFCTKNPTSKKIFWGSQKWLWRDWRIKLGWSKLKYRKCKGKLRLDKKNYHKFPNWHRRFLKYNNSSKKPMPGRMNSQNNLRILKIRRDGESWLEKILMKRLSMPKLVF